MKNIDLWKPSKFNIRKKKLVPSSKVGVTSYRMASYIALFYSEQIETYCKGDLLDLGCGSVPMYDYYKSKATNITCADWENCSHETSHIDVFCDLNDKLPFHDNTFDTIIFSDVIEHLKNPFNSLCEIKRVLNKNGKIIMNYPFMYGIHEAPFDYSRYTKYRMRTWIEELDMNIIVENEYGNLYVLFEHTILRILVTIKGGKYIARLLLKISIFIKKITISKNSTHTYMYGYVIQK